MQKRVKHAKTGQACKNGATRTRRPGAENEPFSADDAVDPMRCTEACGVRTRESPDGEASLRRGVSTRWQWHEKHLRRAMVLDVRGGEDALM